MEVEGPAGKLQGANHEGPIHRLMMRQLQLKERL